MYDLPSAASGDEGLEGFAVAGADAVVGRVAAVNRRADGVVLVVGARDAHRVVQAGAIDRIEMRSRVVRLTPAGERALAAAPTVETRVLTIESPDLVRYLPRELDRLVVEGEAPASTGPPRVVVLGAALAMLGALAIFVGAPLTAEAGGASSRWLWLAAPGVLLVVGAALLWRANVRDLLTYFFGISPRTPRRP